MRSMASRPPSREQVRGARDELRPLVKALDAELQRRTKQPRRGEAPTWQWLLVLLYERYPPPAFADDATRAAEVVAVRCIDATGASTPGGSPGGGAKGQAVKALRKALRQYRESALAPHARAALLRHLSQSRSPLQLLRVPPTPTACASRPHRVCLPPPLAHGSPAPDPSFCARLADPDKNRAELYGARWAALCEEVAKMTTWLLAEQMHAGEQAMAPTDV